jgi:hypothetical protein
MMLTMLSRCLATVVETPVGTDEISYIQVWALPYWRDAMG